MLYMIQITPALSLKPIKASDSKELYTLMQEIYPSAYQHFWKDKGEWYVNTVYSAKNIKKELLEVHTAYFFILFNNEVVGNFRILWDHKLPGFENKKSVKLHRVYVLEKTQGNGIGKTLLTWLENTAKEKGYELIWLDAMDEQPQAFQFYKKQGYKYHSHEFLDFELLYDNVRKMSQIYKEINQ